LKTETTIDERTRYLICELVSYPFKDGIVCNLDSGDYNGLPSTPLRRKNYQITVGANPCGRPAHDVNANTLFNLLIGISVKTPTLLQ
ncbi:MAG: hypothetical protein NTW61_09340, partial [Candidatus Melainabacteria bacterium]|nr:hypothetical protein [Candidatus Melainabacteria bacterium]